MKTRLVTTLLAAAVMAYGAPSPTGAQIDVLTVDITPLVSPGPDFFGHLQNTMGLALIAVDQGSDFNVTEVTPAAFSVMLPSDIDDFDLVAINNNPMRIAGGIGVNWQSVIGINSGGRVVLSSHDAVRFHMNQQPGDFNFFSGPPPCALGVEPFGAPDLVRQAALWAGGGTGTGLLIFNDAQPFVGGTGWNNPELNLPALWGITDLFQNGTGDGGFTDILPAFAAHPVYAGLSDIRFDVNSISSFSANLGDLSYHSVFGAFNPAIFTPTEVIINAGQIDVLGCGCCSFNTAPGPNGTAITLIRDEEEPDCSGFPCGNNGNKVLLCHVPPGNPANEHTLCISPNAVAAHLANHEGDHCGPCAAPLALLAVESNAPGVLIDVTPMDNNREGGGFAPFERSYELVSLISLTAPKAQQGRTFVRWDFGTAFVIGADGLTLQLLVIAGHPQTVTAIYSPPQPQLNAGSPPRRSE